MKKYMVMIFNHFFPIVFLLLLSFISCCTSSLHEDPFHNNSVAHGYAFQAYPSYLSTNIDESKFPGNSINHERETLKVKKFDEEGRLLSSAGVVSVDDFGAKGDGNDDTEAFEKAWKKACSSSGVVLVVPKKSYLVKPIRFSGPCTHDLTLMIYGTIEASGALSDYNKDERHWLSFEGVENLMVGGGGTINGNGKNWWKNSCKVDKSQPCKDAPTAVTFYNSKNVNVKDLKIQNAQQIHVSFEKCVNVQASNLVVTAPGNSPNTDGIHVTDSQNVHISTCTIGTGDDCISIVSGSQKVQATDITCGPGHGISIGSLGSGHSEAHVSDVLVNGAKLTGTTNGVRIKTWPGGSGSASSIKFQNVEMHNVANPIIIDQNYCDKAQSCTQGESAVQVKNVVYQNIKGTSASDIAITLDCSKSFPCQGIVLQNVNLQQQQGKAKAFCRNAKVSGLGVVSPSCSSSA